MPKKLHFTFDSFKADKKEINYDDYIMKIYDKDELIFSEYSQKKYPNNLTSLEYFFI